MKAVAMAAALAIIAACGGNNGPGQGEAGGHCYPNGTCNVTLSCIGGYCVAARDAPKPDAAIDAPALDAHVDAPVDAFPCSNDGAYEPNNSVAQAYALPDPLSPDPLTLSSLAICPSGDKDYFSLILTNTAELKADVTYGTTGAVLSGAVLNFGGTPIKTMTPLVGQTDTLEADAANLPAGMYYIEIFSTAGVSNYSLTITIL